MTLDCLDTIVAVASAPGGGCRGILRLSGSHTPVVLQHCLASQGAFPLDTRRACAWDTQLILPEMISVPCRVLYWPNQRSYTRQAAAELHLPGSPPLLDMALETLCRAGARLARPGEFTLRAFLAGRIDLVQAEAVLGIVDARGEMQRETALRQLAGGLSDPLRMLRTRLLELLAHLEAGLDFVEEDIEFISRSTLAEALRGAVTQIQEVRQCMEQRGTIAADYRVVLRGLPNVGKSSLFNALLGRTAALVSEQAGTTRDYVTAKWVLGRLECQLVDTAGMEDVPETDALRSQAQRVGQWQAGTATVEVICLDRTRPLTSAERKLCEERSPDGRLFVITKGDLPAHARFECPASGAIDVCSRTGLGLPRLSAAVQQMLESQSGELPGIVPATLARCGESVRDADDALHRALVLVDGEGNDELIACELREALHAIGRMVGEVYTDDLLDQIFSRFCIGK